MAPGRSNALTLMRWPTTSRILDLRTDPADLVSPVAGRLNGDEVVGLLAGQDSWSAELQAALHEHGMRAVRAFHLFPDAYNTRVILSEAATTDPSLAAFCGQVLGRAVTADDTSWHRPHDLLVVAGRSTSMLDGVVDPGIVAWRFTHPARRSLWQDVRSFHAVPGTAEIGVRLVEPHSTSARLDWLSRHRPSVRSFVPGRVVRDVVLAAYQQGDVETVAACLRSWRDWLAAHTVSGAPPAGASHPFARGFDGSGFLPSEFLDVNLTNFVEAVDGSLHFIDDEWRADGGVSLDAVCLRGLWYLARELIDGPGRPPRVQTVSELLEWLCALADVPWSDRMVTDVLLPAEAELQHLVSGRDLGVVLTELIASHQPAAQPSPVRYESAR